MSSTQADCEQAYRRMLASKRPTINNDEKIIKWLRGLGTAVSAWEQRWLDRLTAK